MSQEAHIMVWGSLYVILKWTVGLWLLRRGRAWYATTRRRTTDRAYAYASAPASVDDRDAAAAA